METVNIVIDHAEVREIARERLLPLVDEAKDDKSALTLLRAMMESAAFLALRHHVVDPTADFHQALLDVKALVTRVKDGKGEKPGAGGSQAQSITQEGARLTAGEIMGLLERRYPGQAGNDEVILSLGLLLAYFCQDNPANWRHVYRTLEGLQASALACALRDVDAQGAPA